VALLCLAQLALWGTTFGFAYRAPEIDSAEQFIWAFSLENGYWKHPPMPSWIMHGLIGVFGTSVALPFVAAQASIVIALALCWRLGCEFMSPRRSLIAMLLTSLVTYYNIGGDNFNHNYALLPFQAATLLMFHRATRQGQWHQWALAGLFAGLSMLVKYVALLPLAGLLLYVALDRSLHTRRHLAGLALAGLTMLVVLVPHALWLQATSFLPFRYAASVSQAAPGFGRSLQGLGEFLMVQAVRLLPLLAGLWFLMRTHRSAAVGDAPSSVAWVAPAASSGRLLFLWIAALTPLGITLLAGLVLQTELQSRWGTNSFLLTGWLVMAVWPRADTARMLRRAIAFAACTQVLLCAGMVLAKTVVADHLKVRTRANFPGAALAAHAQATWRLHSAAPLRLVVSDIWLGGNIVANTRQRVAVLIDGRHFKSPWVKERTIADCGALILDDQTSDAAGRGEANPALDALMAKASRHGVWVLPWASGAAAPDRSAYGSVRWGIILPASGAKCPI
jgi:4-amino-4-deoxy-L-arabinose transferase-like glycosyltransferase